MVKKFKKSILTALVAAIALPLILALYLLLQNNTITVQAEEVLTVSTAEELSAQLSASDTVAVQLTTDISSDTTFTVSGVKTLDLNGYVVTFTGETGSVISVAEGAEFTLKDSDPTKENTVGDKTVNGGVITGGNADNGGGVYVNGSFTMEGGTISGNTSTGNNYDCGGGGVYVAGTFTMNDGTISGNTAQQHGGGVHSIGTFTMKGGAISGNISSSRGGGVYVYDSTFKINGGTIGGSSDGNANRANLGGGVAVESSYSNPSGNFEMTDGTIIGNKSTSGGGGVHLAINTECTISGGSLINNIADGGSGGGIYVDGSSNTTLNISNAEIRGCAANTGGGIFVNHGSTANISNVTITECSSLIKDINSDDDKYYSGSAIYAVGMATVHVTAGEISGNNDGAAIYWYGMPGGFVISGSPVIYGNQDGDMDVSNTAYKFEDLESDAKIGITGTPPISADGVFTSGGAITEDNVKCFYSNDQKCITVQGGEAILSNDDHVYSEPVWSWDEDCTSATAAFTCNNCQHVETVTASGENITNIVTTPATCTSTGETAYTATVEFNGNTKTDTKPRETAKIPHDYTGSTNYNSDGAQHWKICKDCTAEDNDHKENCSGGDTATCTAKSVCLSCGNEYGDLNENNHAWGEWTVTKEASVGENGEEQRVCSRNSTHIETRQTDKLAAPDDNGGLSAGATAGIVVACILLALLIIYVVCYFALYRRGILLKGKFFDAIYAPMNAIFGKKEQEEKNS